MYSFSRAESTWPRDRRAIVSQAVIPRPTKMNSMPPILASSELTAVGERAWIRPGKGAAEEGHQQDDEQDGGEGVQHVDDPHQDGVGAAAP